MQQLLKSLNSNKSLIETELEELIKNLTINELNNKDNSYKTSDNLKYLLEYKHAKTHDNILIYAARFKNLNLIKFLFEHEIDFNYTNKDGKNALHEACQSSDLNCVKFLVEIGKINVNSLRKADWTPLMLACTRDNLEVIKFLVNNGSNIYIKNKDGWNAFHVAVREGHFEIVNYILSLDVCLIEIKTNNLRTVLHTAALHGHYEILKLLADKKPIGFPIDIKDSCGITPLMDSLASNNVKIAKLLIDNYKANVNDVDSIGNSCVHISAQAGALDSLKYLIHDLKLNIKNILNKYNMTPLHSACKNNHYDAGKYLIENNLVNIEQKDINGRSALDICFNGKYQKCIDLFK